MPPRLLAGWVPALVILVGASAAQVTWTVAPGVVPVEQPIRMTLSNQTPNPIGMGRQPPWSIHDSQSQQITPQIGLPVFLLLQPGMTSIWTWNPRINASTYLAPGAYTARLVYWVGSASTTLSAAFQVMADHLTARGTPAPGSHVVFSLDSRHAPGLPYQMACAFSRTPVILLGNSRELELASDALLLASLIGGPPTFQAFSGTLDSSGKATAGVRIPNLAALKGQRFHVAYVTLKPNAPHGIFSYCYARTVTIL